MVFLLKWEKFLNPVGPPDPRNLPQINTYLETVEADTSNENIADVLNLCQLFFEVSLYYWKSMK